MSLKLLTSTITWKSNVRLCLNHFGIVVVVLAFYLDYFGTLVLAFLIGNVLPGMLIARLSVSWLSVLVLCSGKLLRKNTMRSVCIPREKNCSEICLCNWYTSIFSLSTCVICLENDMYTAFNLLNKYRIETLICYSLGIDWSESLLWRQGEGKLQFTSIEFKASILDKEASLTLRANPLI